MKGLAEASVRVLDDVALAMVQKKTSPVLSKKTHAKKTKRAEVETAQGWRMARVSNIHFFLNGCFSALKTPTSRVVSCMVTSM